MLQILLLQFLILQPLNEEWVLNAALVTFQTSEFPVGNFNWNAPRSRMFDLESRKNLTNPNLQI